MWHGSRHRPTTRRGRPWPGWRAAETPTRTSTWRRSKAARASGSASGSRRTRVVRRRASRSRSRGCTASTRRGGDRVRLAGGTSFAAPHVAGVGGLVLSREPNLTTAQLRARLLDTVDPVPSMAGRTVTGGRLNARRAVGLPDPAAPGTGPSGQPETTPGPQPAADRSAPRCSVRVQRRRSIAGVRRRGLRVAIRCGEAGGCRPGCWSTASASARSPPRRQGGQPHAAAAHAPANRQGAARRPGPDSH